MMTLYVLRGCPYCAKVLHAAEDLGIAFDQREISDPNNSRDLIARGGKRQVPYLIDPATGTEMYESDDIVAYLRERYAKPA